MAGLGGAVGQACELLVCSAAAVVRKLVFEGGFPKWLIGKRGDLDVVIWVDNVVIVPRKTMVTRSKRPHLHFLRNMIACENIEVRNPRR
jgi:hypothetical protein